MKREISFQQKSKLMPRVDGRFDVLEYINDNGYKVNLLEEYGVLSTFDVANLSSYQKDDCLSDLRVNSSQQRKNDGGQLHYPHQAHKIAKKVQFHTSKSKKWSKRWPKNSPFQVARAKQA